MKLIRLLALLLLAPAPTRATFDRSLEAELVKDFGIDIHMPGDWIDRLNSKLAEFKYESIYCGCSTNLLFNQYPELQNKIPYVALGSFPTPIQKLNKLSLEYGLNIYIKRDDLSGGCDESGSPIYGGNKVRKLEFLLGHAQALGATKVMTFGCVGSNHAVATAVHANRLYMEPICMLKHQAPSRVVQHNLLMHLNCSSQLHFNQNNDIRKLNALMVWLEEYKKDGMVPYIIPTGGSNYIGTLGFVNAAFELAEHIKRSDMPKPNYIYVACGSCATTAGLLLGCKAAGIDAKIIAIAVEPNNEFASTIDRLFKEANAYLHACDPSFPLCTYSADDLVINNDFAGPNYGIFTQEGARAARELAEKEGITLEGTYTAKAFAGLLGTAHQDSGDVILFWNTYCGLDMSGTLRNRDNQQLPECLQTYFDNGNLQETEIR